MQNQIISIAKRKQAPATNLYIETFVKNELGERPIVFILPGGPGADSSGYASYQCLFEVADLIFHDPRGCGKSDCGDVTSYSMDNYIDDVEAIRQHLKLNNIIVLGKSYGSMCALGYAIRYPQHLKKLILAAGAPSFRFLKTAKENLKRIGTEEQKLICEKLWNASFRDNDEVRDFQCKTSGLYSLKSKSEGVSDVRFALDYQVVNQGFKTFLCDFDFENDLHKVACETLILAGKHDWINDITHMKVMAKGIPNNQLVVFEDASHAMENDATDRYFQAIRDFIV